MKKPKECYECCADCSGRMEIFRNENWFPVCSQCYRKLLPSSAHGLECLDTKESFLLRKLEIVRKPIKFTYEGQEWLRFAEAHK